MNLYILSVILSAILFIPVSSAGAVSFVETANIDYEGPPVYVFAQTIQKDSNGNFLALIQSLKFTDLNSKAVNYYMDVESSKRELQKFSYAGRTVEIFSEQFTNTIDHPNLTASTLLVILIPIETMSETTTEVEWEELLTARFAHDGLLLSPGDTMSTTWFFARIL